MPSAVNRPGTKLSPEACDPERASSPAPTLYWVSTGWACGGVFVRDGKVIPGGAPIFRKFIGQAIAHLAKSYRVVEVEA